MKTTKELKQFILVGFTEVIDLLLASERNSQFYKNAGNEQKGNERREKKYKYQEKLLNAIEGLIEVEGE